MKMEITFDGFDKLVEEIDRCGGNLRQAADEALSETQRLVQTEVTKASAIYSTKGGGRKGYATGAMVKKIIKNPEVTWEGTKATVEVGFIIKDAGIHTIFLMHGTPKMQKDQKLYDAVFGEHIKNMIATAQEDIMRKYLTIGG